MFRPLLLSILTILACQVVQAADYYWVGGNGDWSDISHWATTSGGATRHNVVPTPNDRVFFDANSFTGPNQRVNVNNQSIFCLDMIWDNVSNNPTFSAPGGYILNIYGSLRLNANMVFAFNGSVNFLATTNGHNIFMAGHRFRQLVNFSGQGGAWTLQSPLNTDSTLLITAGSLNTGNQSLSCKRWFVTPNAAVSLDLGSSRILVSGATYTSRFIYQYDSASVEFRKENLTVSPGSSVIEFSSNKPMLRVTGTGGLSLGTVFFSNTSGKGRVISEVGGAVNLLKLDMRTDTDVEGSANFDTLSLGKGKNFRFQSGFTYRLKKMIALGECIAPIQIFSNTSGTQFTFESSSDSITGNFVSIKDIRASGGAKFVLRNAADLGNNTGWDISTKTNNNLYWVGGNGNWSDPVHWSFSSGGAGGACIPTAGDNVFFDANSGNSFTVNIDIENAYCRSMSWIGATGTPRLNGTDEKALHLFGSLSFIAGLRQDFQGDVYFEGDNQNNVITSAGKIFQRRVIVNGTGAWSLADSLSILLDFVFQQGNFDTKNQKVFTRSVYSQTINPRKFKLGTTHWVLRRVDLQNYNSLVWDMHAPNLTLDADSSIIEFRNWYGNLNSTAQLGTTELQYNVVWFYGGDGALYTYYRNSQSIDSIKCITSLYTYGRNSLGVLDMLTPSNLITITVSDTLAVREILTPDLCTGMIEVRTTTPGQKSYLKSPAPLVVRRMMIQDIGYLGSGTATANNSIDLGGNQGWVINEIAGRDLYWVGKGGNGNWFDPINWSLSSGGTGGECIPTAKDNVFFDANSFSGPNQSVVANSLHAYCRNMTWTGINQNPYLYIWILNAFGSMDFPQPFNGANVFNLYLRSKVRDQTIRTRGLPISTLQIFGQGSWILQDSLSVFNIYHYEGEFNSNNYPVNANSYYSTGFPGNKQILKMGSSHWRIASNGADFSYTAYFGNNLMLDAGTSLIEFTNTDPFVYIYGNHTFHNVLFSNAQGTSTWRTEGDPARIGGQTPYIARLNRLEFRNNGIMYGQNILDSLIFTAGKTYQLDATLDQTINEYFQVIGNNCNPIELRSTAQGTKAEVIMNGGRVLADFVQMRDQRGVGSTQFLAGANSTNIANSNERWVFDSPVEYVDEGILGKDAVLCKNNSLTLDANTFSPGETYRWNDGSTRPTFSVNRAGTYFVAVTYNDGCILRDTVRVLPAADFTPNLIADTTLCANDSLRLDAELNLVGATYRWQDGSTASNIRVSTAGQYKVTIELSGCTASDSTQVRIVSPSAINLGRDTSICDGQSLLLDASKSGGRSYLWSDGSTGSSLSVTATGLYWVEVNDGQCTARDSINLSVLPALGLNLGRDTSFCEGGNYLIRSNLGNLAYRWNDGSTASSLSVSTAGVYWLEARGNGCTERDSINIRVQALPRFEFGGDTILCEGTRFTLSPTLNVSGTPTYRWSTGSTNSSIVVQFSGVYTATVTLNACTFSDQKRFTFNPGPAFELGANRGFCIGESYRPDITLNGARYLWNTGATTSRLLITQTGLYYVDVTVNGCTKRDSAFYTFAPEPKFNLGRDTTLCAGESLLVSATTANATYRWNNGNTTATRTFTQGEVAWADVTVNGCRKRDSIRVQFIDLPRGLLGADTVLCDGQTRSYQINVPGANLLWQDNSSANPYVISSAGLYILQASSGRCSVLDSVQIGYKPYPNFTLGSDTTLCNNENLNLNPNVAGATYRWNDGQSSIPRQLSQSGTYWLEVDLNGCARRDTVNVLKINLPPSLFGADTTLCEGRSLTLRAQVPNTTVQWQDGSNNPTLVVSQAGIYWAQIGLDRCQIRDSIMVAYNPLPRFSLGRDTALCEGESLALTALAGVDQVRWSTGATSESISVNRAGTYWAQVTDQNCSFGDSIKVEVLAIPQVALGPDTLVCDDKPFVLQASGSGNAQLLWSDGSSGKSLSASTAGSYWVRASNGRCSASDTLVLSLRECIVFKAFTPNAFSPDGNTANETFRPFLNELVKVNTYELQVFDRWGGQAFRSTDINAGWDGLIRGQKAPQGVYIYWFRIEYEDDKGPGNALIKGEVTLLR